MDQQEAIAKLKAFSTDTLFLLHTSEQFEGRIYRPRNDPSYNSRIYSLESIGAAVECVFAPSWARRAAAEELLERGDLKVWESETLNAPAEESPNNSTAADCSSSTIQGFGKNPIQNLGNGISFQWADCMEPVVPIPPELTIDVGSRARVVRGPLAGFTGRVLQIVEGQTRIRLGHKGDGPFIEVPIVDVQKVDATATDRHERKLEILGLCNKAYVDLRFAETDAKPIPDEPSPKLKDIFAPR